MADESFVSKIVVYKSRCCSLTKQNFLELGCCTGSGKSPSRQRDGYEMLKAMYDFKSTTYTKSLNFQLDDVFIIYEINTKKRQWWEVLNDKGQVGYVPSNYVSPIQVTFKYFMQFLDGCINSLRSEEKKIGGCLPSDKQRLLSFLYERRRKAEMSYDHTTKRHSPHLHEPAISRTGSSTSFVPSAMASMTMPSSVSGTPSVRGEGEIFKNSSKLITQQHDVIPKHIAHASASDTLSRRHSERNREVAKRTVSNIEIRRSPGKSYNTETSCEAKPNVTYMESIPVSNIATNVTNNPFQIPSKSELSSKSSMSIGQNSSVSNRMDLGAQTAYNLVEQVRRHTHLSHELSRVAVGVVISHIRELLVSDINMDECLSYILEQCQGPLEAPQPFIEDTHDAARLRVIFMELTSCKEDSQQRSWKLHEDEETIIEYINELASILSNADASICRHVMSAEQYDGVSTLVQYYQMEVRWSIRKLLLQTFGIMCSLDATVVTLMLNSILPMELARDMESNPRNIPRLEYSSLLLTMIFSMGEPMPIAHLELLGTEFIIFLLDLMESPPDTDVEEQIPDRFLNLLLSYNLQFANSSDNCLLAALEQRENAKTFTEKVLLLINREEDPVRVFDHTPAPPHAVLKLFIDLFSNEKTALLFYTNDIKVLIDIITRQLADLSPGDKRRQQYLELCRRVLRNSSYEEHRHRCDDLLKCFNRIFCEESEQSLEDQRLVREITKEFPKYFQA